MDLLLGQYGQRTIRDIVIIIGMECVMLSAVTLCVILRCFFVCMLLVSGHRSNVTFYIINGAMLVI